MSHNQNQNQVTQNQQRSKQTDILAVVDNVIRLKRDTLGSNYVSDICEELTRENPQWHQMDRMRLRNTHKFKYVKMPPKNIESYFEDSGTIYVPRGRVDLVREFARKYDQKIRWINETILHDRDPGMKMVNGFEPFPYQTANIANPVIKKQGILTMECGGGKTVLGIMLAMTLGQPTLILVHTHDLLEQWLRELASKAVIPHGVGQMGAGTKRPRWVTVATVQTVTRLPNDQLRSFLDTFGCIILDECHHCPAITFLGIMNHSKSVYRYGFTATQKRKDGLEFLMHDVIGPTIADVSNEELTQAGRSQTVVVQEVNTIFHTYYTADQWNDLLGELVTDRDRNDLIVEKVVQTWNDGHFCLVLSSRVAHCKQLCAQLRRHGLRCELLLGEVPKVVRSGVVADAKNNLLDAIVATKVADEGLDIPNLSCLHLTTPTGNAAKLQQQIGRIRRPKDKESLVYDYVDSRVTALSNMYAKRRRFYRNQNFTLLRR